MKIRLTPTIYINGKELLNGYGIHELKNIRVAKCKCPGGSYVCEGDPGCHVKGSEYHCSDGVWHDC